MTEPDEIDEQVEEEQPIPTRRLAYLLLDDDNVIIGRTVFDVPEDQYESEKERLDTAHNHDRHVTLDVDDEVPEVGIKYGY